MSRVGCVNLASASAGYHPIKNAGFRYIHQDRAGISLSQLTMHFLLTLHDASTSDQSIILWP